MFHIRKEYQFIVRCRIVENREIESYREENERERERERERVGDPRNIENRVVLNSLLRYQYITRDRR